LIRSPDPGALRMKAPCPSVLPTTSATGRGVAVGIGAMVGDGSGGWVAVGAGGMSVTTSVGVPATVGVAVGIVRATAPHPMTKAVTARNTAYVDRREARNEKKDGIRGRT
jgi:hypothetical protein